MESVTTINNAPIGVGICSMGMSGVVFHAPFIATNPKFKLVATWERTKNVTSEKYPNVIIYSTLEELLQNDQVELVVVNTPNVTHYTYVKMALMAGKHVVVEKPFVPSVAECDELIQLAAKQNCLLSVYQNRRYDSDFLTVQKILAEGLIGDIREAEFHYDRFDNNLSYKTHKEVPQKGTGCLYDLGSHLIDQALTLFGMPEWVYADIFAMRPISKVDDYFELLMYYNDFRVRLKASYQVRELLPGYVLHGSKGSFVKYKSDTQESALQKGQLPNQADWGIEPSEVAGILHTEDGNEVIRKKFASVPGNYMDYYEGIYRAVRHHQSLPVTAEDGKNVIRIIEAAFNSNEKKCAVKIS